MKYFIFQVRMALFTWALSHIVKLVPQEATKTLTWLIQVPFEDAEVAGLTIK